MKTKKKLLKEIVEAWESLPEGEHSYSIIQNWLVEDMKPAIDNIRKYLGK